MILSLLLISFCLLVSFCMFEAGITYKLITRLQRHKRYIIQFLTIQTPSGLSIETYMLKTLLPKYLIGLGILFLSGISLYLIPTIPAIYKLSGLSFGILTAIWAKIYNRKFLSLLWDKVLLK